MSETTTNRWKLGLFVMSGVVLIFATMFWVGATAFDRVTFPAVTYFDESVQGLDVGSALKFRGVTIGAVSAITVASDGRHVEVHVKVYEDVIERMGFYDADDAVSPRERWGQGEFMSEETRVQLASAGITGLKYLHVDVVEPAAYPPPDLPFETPWNYVPSMKSTLANLEEGITRAVDSLPKVLDDMVDIMAALEARVTATDVEGLVDSARELMTTTQAKLEQLDVDQISSGVTTLVDEIRTGVDRLDRQLTEAELAATTASFRGSADAFTALARDADGLTDELDANLRELRETLRAVRNLAELLERDPSAPLAGKAGSTRP